MGPVKMMGWPGLLRPAPAPPKDAYPGTSVTGPPRFVTSHLEWISRGLPRIRQRTGLACDTGGALGRLRCPGLVATWERQASGAVGDYKLGGGYFRARLPGHRYPERQCTSRARQQPVAPKSLVATARRYDADGRQGAAAFDGWALGGGKPTWEMKLACDATVHGPARPLRTRDSAQGGWSEVGFPGLGLYEVPGGPLATCDVTVRSVLALVRVCA